MKMDSVSGGRVEPAAWQYQRRRWRKALETACGESTKIEMADRAALSKMKSAAKAENNQ